jgi:hypothetical protein
MKAIQTQYNNHLFRSRLEAKWAIFFDEMGIKWEYEPEGFKLDNGIVYVPDFYLPGLGVYIEIKHDYNPFNGDAFDTVDGQVFLNQFPIISQYEKLCWHEDYKPKWLPFSFYQKLAVLFGEPSNDEVLVLWQNSGKVEKIDGEYRMGYFSDASGGDLYEKYKDNFNPKIAGFFMPLTSMKIFRGDTRRAIKKSLSYRFH